MSKKFRLAELLSRDPKPKVTVKSSAFHKKDLQKLLSDKSPFGVKESYGAIRAQLNFARKSEKCPI